MKSFLLVVLALIFPPVAVFVKAGIHIQLFVNLCCCFAFYFPAMIHAVWFVRRAQSVSLAQDEWHYADPYAVEYQPGSRIEPRLD